MKMLNNELLENRKLVTWSVYALVSVLSVWIRSGFQVYGIPDAVHDDALFQNLARHLLIGDWLGPYNNLTLAKGMFYPFFIALSAAIGLPLKIAEQLLYLSCSFLAARYVARLTRSEMGGFILFGLLAFNPVLWSVPLSRVIREGIYLSLAMAFLVLFISTLFPSQSNPLARNRFVIKAFMTGVVAAFYWLTREEGIWLAPALAIIAAFAFVNQWQMVGIEKTVKGFLPKTIMLIVLAFCLVIGWVQYKNWSHYQVFETTEFHSSPFLRAYGAVARIHHEKPRRYIVFPRDARDRAYSVSQAAREMKPYLEGQTGENWKKAGCYQVAPDCSEIASGWFMWALRDAVALSGHYKNGSEAMKFYDQLANEINKACDEKKIKCLPPRSTLAPVFRSSYLLDAFFASKSLFAMLLSLGDGAIKANPSNGTPAQLAIVSDLVGPVNDGEQRVVYVRGWAADSHSVPQIELFNDEQDIVSGVAYSEAKDVQMAMPGYVTVRFEGYLFCGKSCKLRVVQDRASAVLLNKGLLVDQPNLKVYIDELSFEMKPIETARRKLQQMVAQTIQNLYAVIMPILCLFGIIGILLGLMRTFLTRHVSPLHVLALASLIAVITRVALLSYLEVTSIPSINILYASPASPFVIIFAVTGSYQFIRIFTYQLNSRD